MSEINPQNYQGVSTVLVGYAATDVRNPAYDPNGEKPGREVPIAINEGYSKDGEFVQTGTTWYNYAATADFFADNFPVKKGDKVRIDGAKQEVREYTNKAGENKLGITLRFGDVTILESKSPAEDDVPF